MVNAGKRLRAVAWRSGIRSAAVPPRPDRAGFFPVGSDGYATAAAWGERARGA